MSKEKTIFKTLLKYLKVTTNVFINIITKLINDFINLLKRTLAFLKNLWTEIIKYTNHFETLMSYEKFYVIGFIMTFTLIFISIFFSPALFNIVTDKEKIINITVNNLKTSYFYIQTILSWFISVVFTSGYILEVIDKIEIEKKKISKLVFNIFVTAILFIVYVFSELIINHLINDYVQIEPSVFSDGKITLKLIFIPYAWLLLATIFLLLNIVRLVSKLTYNFLKSQILNLFSIFSSSNKIVESKSKIFNDDFKNGTRFFILSIVTVLFLTVLTKAIHKDSSVKQIAMFLFIHSEYYPNSYCKNLNKKNILVADIGGGLYSVYNSQSKKFTVSKCEIDLTHISTK